ncbi:hypothetical protein BSL78_19502 [Apostichopus japonicus]|uniref:Reverse transcriptase domain-containing protein n=1 Tax=Stichopus japonicus TaxID=307972 RepID=A0A2G8K6K5_STIJA|nr:hypothetical protein BSL78_19502 [Apostichopus japonicus]
MSGVQVPLPPKLNLQGNLKKNWEQFKQLWDSYEIVTNLVTKDEQESQKLDSQIIVNFVVRNMSFRNSNAQRMEKHVPAVASKIILQANVPTKIPSNKKAKFVRQVEVESDENESDSLCSSSEESVLSVTLEGKVHLETDPAITPVVIPPRRVPVAIKPMLKAELKRLEQLNVIQKVTKPTDWVSSLVSVTKSSGKLRVCIDPQPLNKALKRGHYPLPVIEDILPQLAKVKVFSKADCKEGFLQCELDNESSYLTTFQTPWGRYRYKRMPFGISPAPELFSKR